jgi:RimJ/RimL family protein N-acetyltransferase
VFVPVLDFLFDTVGIERVKASILLRNQLTLRYLLKLGWQQDETPEVPIKSQADGTPLDRCALRWTRDGYRAFRRTAIGSRILARLASGDRLLARGPATKG